MNTLVSQQGAFPLSFEPSKICNNSTNKQIAEFLSWSKTQNNDGNKMNGSNSNSNLNLNLSLNFTNKLNGKGKDIEETKVDEMSNGKQDRRKRLTTNGNGYLTMDNNHNRVIGNGSIHRSTNDNSSGNNNYKYSNNKNRNERSLMFDGSNSNSNCNSNRSSAGRDLDGTKLDIKDGNSVLSLLNLKADKLGDSSHDYRPVYSCIRPVVCHHTNTPFYAQCSTQKLGYCTWCHELRRGNQKQGSICLNCGERLTAKYHRWYPELLRLQPLEKHRTPELYTQHKQIFEKYGITWDDEKGLEFVMNHYMLLKIWVSDRNFAVDSMHLERTYMIGVFAGREFNTGALARKLLREGCKLAMFRADFPALFEYLRDQRAAVAEQMNARYFQGIYGCYFHAHHTNIEGWYDPQVLTRERIIKTFKYLCDEILKHTVANEPNGVPKSVNMPCPMQTIIQDTPRPIADLNDVPIETITNIECMNLGCKKRTGTLQHGSTDVNSHSRSHHSNHHTNYHPSQQQTYGGATYGACAGAAPTRDARGQGYGHVAQNNGYHTSHLQHNGGYHQTMTGASNMMPSPPHIQTQVGQGGVQFGDLNVGGLSQEARNGIMSLQGLNNLNKPPPFAPKFNANVSPSIGIQNISNVPSMTNMAAMGLCGGGMPSIPNVAALNVGTPNMVSSLSGGSPVMSLTGSLSNVELGMGMGSVINPTFDDFSKHMPSLAFGDPRGVPAGVQMGTAGLRTRKLESLMPRPSPPNLFTKNAAQTFLQRENEAINSGKNKLSIDTNQSFRQLIGASSSPMSGSFNSGTSPLRSLPIISANGISNGVSSINTINTINTQTSTNASSLLMSQSFTNGNLNNSNNFPSPPVSPALSPTFGGALIGASSQIPPQLQSMSWGNIGSNAVGKGIKGNINSDSGNKNANSGNSNANVNINNNNSKAIVLNGVSKHFGTPLNISMLGTPSPVLANHLISLAGQSNAQ